MCMYNIIAPVLMLFHLSFLTAAIAMDAEFETNVRKAAPTAGALSQENHSETALAPSAQAADPAPSVVTTDKTSTKENKNACPKCQKEFERKDSLRRHKKNCGKSLEERSTFVCQKCQKGFTQPIHLTRHAKGCGKSLEEKRNFVCQKCEKRFTDPDSLRRHEKGCDKSLEEKRNFVCSKCKNGFTQKSSLTKHEKNCDKSLEDKKKFVCSKCKKGFTRQNGLTDHEKNCNKPLDERKTFVCSKCERKFTLQCNLNRHKKDCGKSLEERRTFFCSMCQKGYSSQRYLDSHICHKIDAPEKDLETVSESDSESSELENKNKARKTGELKTNEIIQLTPGSHFESKTNSSIGASTVDRYDNPVTITIPLGAPTFENLPARSIAKGKKRKRIGIELSEIRNSSSSVPPHSKTSVDSMDVDNADDDANGFFTALSRDPIPPSIWDDPSIPDYPLSAVPESSLDSVDVDNVDDNANGFFSALSRDPIPPSIWDDPSIPDYPLSAVPESSLDSVDVENVDGNANGFFSALSRDPIPPSIWDDPLSAVPESSLDSVNFDNADDDENGLFSALSRDPIPPSIWDDPSIPDHLPSAAPVASKKQKLNSSFEFKVPNAELPTSRKTTQIYYCTRKILRDWFLRNLKSPFPTGVDKEVLLKVVDEVPRQLDNLFTNEKNNYRDQINKMKEELGLSIAGKNKWELKYLTDSDFNNIRQAYQDDRMTFAALISRGEGTPDVDSTKVLETWLIKTANKLTTKKELFVLSEITGLSVEQIEDRLGKDKVAKCAPTTQQPQILNNQTSALLTSIPLLLSSDAKPESIEDDIAPLSLPIALEEDADPFL